MPNTKVYHPPNEDSLLDIKLAKASAMGDMEAFEELYKRHSNRVYAQCISILHNSEVAEDLTQEVFIELYRKIKSFKGDSKFTTWLFVFTKNQVLMHLRKNKKSDVLGDQDNTVEIIMDKTCSVRPESLDARMDLENAIAKLPNGYRSVAHLCLIEGHEHKETAVMLGISEGTSKSQLHKAKAKLQMLLRRLHPST